MTWFALQSLFLILGAFVLGVLVGWLVWGRQERQERIVVLHGDGTGPRAATRQQQATATTPAATPDTGSTSLPAGDAPADDEPHWLRARPPEEPATATGPPAGPATGTPAGPATGTPDVVDLRETPDVVDLRDEPAAGAPPAAEPGRTGKTGQAGQAGEPGDGAPGGRTGATEPDDTTRPTEAAAGTGPGGPDERGPAERDPDDLGRIEGISPKIETALHENGITSYRQLATCDEFRLRSILRNAGLRFTPTLTSWAEQAELLAQGDDEGFAVLSARVAADHRAAGTA